MTAYIITIRREGPGSESSGQTVVRFDVSSGQPRIRELRVTADDEDGLAPADLPNIDIELLVQALGGTRGKAVGRRSRTVPPTRAEKALTVAPGSRHGAGNSGATRAVTGRRRPLGANAPAGERGGEQIGRSYRRMPNVDEVLAVYEKTGTISALAEHYGVPRHTAQGWAGRLRRLGYAIGRG